MRKIYILVSILVVFGATVAVWLRAGNNGTHTVACTMEAKLCPDGSAVGRTGPNCEFAECANGIDYTSASADLIKVESPVPGEAVGKNFSVEGVARGTWFFEASFPVVVLGKDGEVLVETYATANGEWMTENFVPFHSDIKIPESYSGPAKLILKKDNPSGLPEHDASISFGVVVSADAKKDLMSTSTIKGTVTLSPICPVERMPPEPQCAPKPYQTKIEVLTSLGGKLVKSIQTGSDGGFTLTLPFGNYTIQAGGGTIHPSCSPVAVRLETSTVSVDISCDTGIR